MAVTREDLCTRFWSSLLEQAGMKTDLFTGGRPAKQEHLARGAAPGTQLVFAFGRKAPRVELYIRGKKGWTAKQMFERLFDERVEIESRFGAPLGWQRLDGKQSCRIRFDLSPGSIRDEAEWHKIQNEMIAAMIRFEKALRPNLDRLR